MSEGEEWIFDPLIPAAKIDAYLLNVDHPEGGPKARYFFSRGFSLDEASAFVEALFLHAVKQNFVKEVHTPFAVKLIYEAMMPMPDGTAAKVRSVWQVRAGERTQTLVTAYCI